MCRSFKWNQNWIQTQLQLFSLPWHQMITVSQYSLAQGLACACFAFEVTQLDSTSEHKLQPEHQRKCVSQALCFLSLQTPFLGSFLTVRVNKCWGSTISLLIKHIHQKTKTALWCYCPISISVSLVVRLTLGYELHDGILTDPTLPLRKCAVGPGLRPWSAVLDRSNPGQICIVLIHPWSGIQISLCVW